MAPSALQLTTLDQPVQLAGDGGVPLGQEAGQQAWVRLHGDRGLMENLRHGDTRTLRVVWDAQDGEDWRRAEEVYLPWPPEFPATDADPMGDGVVETPMPRG